MRHRESTSSHTRVREFLKRPCWHSWSIDASEDKDHGKAAHGGVFDTAPGPFFPRNHYATVTHGLPPGRHVLRIKVLPEHDATSSGHRLLIGYIMVAGTPES